MACYWVFRNAHLGEQRAWPVMGHDYASLSPGVITVCSLLDHQRVLALMTFFSILLSRLLISVLQSRSPWPRDKAEQLTGSWTTSGLPQGYLFSLLCAFRSGAAPLLAALDISADSGSFGMQMTFACHNWRLLSGVRRLVAMDKPGRMAYLKNFNYSCSNGNITFSASSISN